MTPPRLQAKQGANNGNGKDHGLNNQDSNPVEHQEDSGSTTDDSDFEVQPSKSANTPAVAQKRFKASRADAFNIAQGLQKARADVPGQLIDTSTRRKEFVSNPNLCPKGIDPASSSEGDGMQIDHQHMVASKSGFFDKTSNTAAKPKPRIGKIGGKTDFDKESSKPAVATPAKPDSDRINEREAISKASESARVGRAAAQPRSPSPTRETSQERANRKRERLKRELESKGQAGAKKKRKF